MIQPLQLGEGSIFPETLDHYQFFEQNIYFITGMKGEMAVGLSVNDPPKVKCVWSASLQLMACFQPARQAKPRLL